MLPDSPTSAHDDTGAPALLDEGGLLRHGGRWVVIPDSQLPLVELLLRNFGRLVRREELERVYVDAGGTANPTSVRTALARLRGRVEEVGLRLESVKGRGVVLERDDDIVA